MRCTHGTGHSHRATTGGGDIRKQNEQRTLAVLCCAVLQAVVSDGCSAAWRLAGRGEGEG